MLCCLLEAAGLEADFSCSCRMKSTSPLCSRVAIQNLLGSNERRSHQFHAGFAALQRYEQQTETRIMPRLQGRKMCQTPQENKVWKFNQVQLLQILFTSGYFWCHSTVSVAASTLAELQTMGSMCN